VIQNPKRGRIQYWLENREKAKNQKARKKAKALKGKRLKKCKFQIEVINMSCKVFGSENIIHFEI